MKVQIEKRLEELVPQLLKSLNRYIDDLTVAIGFRKPEDAARLGHLIKGDCAGFGLEKLSAMGAAIEVAARDGNWPSVERETARLRDAYAKIEIDYI